MARLWKGLVVVVVAAGLAAKFRFSAVPVQVFVAQPTNVVAEVMGTGTLEARVKTTISPRIQERLAEVLVDQGDAVSAGQLLARLDDGELNRLVEVAEAALASAQATAERVRADEARSQAVEEQARRDHRRITELLATKVSSPAEMDKAVEQWRVAESDLNRAHAATAEALRQVTTAEKNLAYQRERLGFTRIVSPYAGIITRRDRDPGGVVVPGSSLLQLISTNELWVSAWVDETASAGLAIGQPARVGFRSDGARDCAGEVARLGRETDRETREFLVDVRVIKPPTNWTIGQRADVFIETGRKPDVLAVPQRVLQWREGKPGLLVAEGRRAAWRDVTLGLRGRELVEIAQGLAAGDRVIVPANSKPPALQSGQLISVK